MNDKVIEWLLRGDPSIGWQVLRDLKGAAEPRWRAEQQRVATEGWGARLLALQREDGGWTRGLYTPKWTSTTYTMVLLRGLGLESGNAQAVRGCARLLDAGIWTDGGINFWRKAHDRSETCVSSMVLAVVSWFGVDDIRVDRLAEHVIARQMKDGGWNCRATPGYGHATHGSFHTTISALEGLLDYERMRPEHAEAARAAQARGREFLLRHRLFRSHRTGRVVKTEMTRFSWPPQWHYDVLRGVDYFRACGASLDSRLGAALDLIENRRQADGRWVLQNEHKGQMHFRMEAVGEPSRWNTLRALRVLAWAGR